MVRLRLVGGRLIKDRLEEAARLHAQGDVSNAVTLYREIVREFPRETEALCMLGVIAQQAGNAPLALKFTEIALDIKPDNAKAWYNRSVILRVLGRAQDALESARLAVEHAPDSGEAWDIIGQLFMVQGSYIEAMGAHARAIELQPRNAEFHANLAALLFAIGDYGGAAYAALKAERLDSAHPPMLLGTILQAMGYPAQAAPRFARMRALKPYYYEAFASEAMAHLQKGDFEKGWALWEHRPDFTTLDKEMPLWAGQKIDRLLIYEDQGLGDAIQFLRYLPWLKTRANHILLRLRAPLVRLCAENFPEVEVIAEDASPSGTEARCRLSSLPFFFGTSLENIPALPYLSGTNKDRAVWRERLGAVTSPRIGFVWAGNPHFHNNAARCVPFGALHEILEASSGRGVALQKGVFPELQETYARYGLFDAAPLLEDFADTAALMQELDLIIAVDTAAAHLAGALGKPVFILIPFSSDWRWLLGRADSPWYPTARLFRQKTKGDWAPVIADLAHNIRKFIAGDPSVLIPVRMTVELLQENPYAIPLPPMGG